MEEGKYDSVHLSTVISQLESCHFNYALNNIQQAKKDCLETIKLLNKISKTSSPQNNQVINELSKLTLNTYDKISKKTKGPLLTVNEKIIWIQSKVSGIIYPPLIDISAELDSMNSRFITSKEVHGPALEIPDNIESTYEAIVKSDWSTLKFDLDYLYQDLLSNCSFVSAFLSITSNKQYLQLTNSISPFADSNVYKVKLHFNGSWRVVEVDNTLPKVHSNRTLIIKSSSNCNLYWPAFIEKAYLKVMGHGYNFNGSNHANDIFTLLGWLPETIYIPNGQLPAVFSEALAYYSEGKALIGFGTGKLTSDLCNQLGIISNHDYSFQSYKDGCLTLKNPWSEDINLNESRVKEFYDLNVFKYLYINWNYLSLFKYRCNKVFIFNIADRSPNRTFEKPQYSLSNSTEDKQKVWILLEKFLPLKEEDEMIQIHIFQTIIGERVICPVQYICKNESQPTNNNLLLVKFELEPMTAYTVVVSSTSNSTYSLSLYHNILEDFKLTKAKYKFSTVVPSIKDEWTGSTNGGPWNFSSYIDNPEYLINVNTPTNISICLFSDPNVYVNMHIFHSDAQDANSKIKDYDRTSLIVDQKYNLEYQMAEVHLQPGSYKCLLSTYQRNISPYEMVIYHDQPSESLTIEKVPNSLGLFVKKKLYQWKNTNRLKIHLQITNFNVDLNVHLKCIDGERTQTDSDYRPGIRGSIFNAVDSSPVCINEEWTKSLYGAFIACKIQTPSTYILLIERFEQGEGDIMVSIGSNKNFSIDK